MMKKRIWNGWLARWPADRTELRELRSAQPLQPKLSQVRWLFEACSVDERDVVFRFPMAC